jgi:hypothetical protein
MVTLAARLARATRWLPLVVVVSLAGPSMAGWDSTVVVLAQADSEDQQPADMPAPAADMPAPADAGSPTAVVEETPADTAMPAPEEAVPAAEETVPAMEETVPATGDTPASPPQAGDVQVCVSVTSTPNGTVTVATQPCPADSP